MVATVAESEVDFAELRKRVLSLSPVTRNEILLDLVVSLQPPGRMGESRPRRIPDRMSSDRSASRDGSLRR